MTVEVKSALLGDFIHFKASLIKRCFFYAINNSYKLNFTFDDIFYLCRVTVKSYIAYFLLFLVVIVFCHNATLHGHTPEVALVRYEHHHHHHADSVDIWDWLRDLVHDWEHTDFIESHFEDFTLSSNFERVLHPIVDIVIPSLFLLSDDFIEYKPKTSFFYGAAYIEPPPYRFSSPRAPPSFSWIFFLLSGDSRRILFIQI